jgi:O-antigen/teichoic acid export membrane protein
MRRLLLRRSATAVGIYSSFAFGLLGTIAASRELPSLRAFGDYSTVLFATSFLQSFFDLTAEEALVKYGFRYVSREEWGRLRRLFASALWVKLAGSSLGAIGLLVFAAFAPSRLTVALLLAAGIPLGQSLEGLAGIPLYLRSRYDVRSAFLAWSMLLRLAGILVGAHFGVAQAIAGLLAAQVVATGSLALAGRRAFTRFPAAAAVPLGSDRGEIARFVLKSSSATGVASLRGSLLPLILGAVTSTTQTGLFKVAQAPQSVLGALSSPARMVLLTEQTRDWEHGRQSDVLRGVRRYSLLAFALSVVIVPPLMVWIPSLISLVNGARYVGASNAARIFALTAAVHLVVGWAKSFAVSIGRPGLRVWTFVLEAAVSLPLVFVLAGRWGAAGAAGAVLAGSVAYALAWAVIVLRMRPEDSWRPDTADLRAEAAEIESEAGALAR